MPRIVGIDIPNEKKVWISLSYIQGIGRTTSIKMLKELGIDGDKRSKDLTE
ncbi:MAG: 30S ribosomal protein S13, partial [Planctomycetes bacterium]|nr:30S ribosomal protein S13 [Planctomycetota bacterium]